jgi:ubiquinone/menaquinone biosynthesis C-methylase UbiE
MEDKANIVDAFSEMAPRYEQVVDSELNRFWGWSYHGLIDLILASTPVQQQDIILDIATGTGVIPYRLEKAGHPHNQIHGLDITMSMLTHASRRLRGLDGHVKQNLVCASAMDMPYAKSGFTQVICGLATHHMDVKKLILECHRVLRIGGRLTIADVGGAHLWKVPGVKFLFQMAAFIYFILFENKTRAWAEARAVSNVLSRDEWNLVLVNSGFRDIVIRKLKSQYFWVPAPLLIKAENNQVEEQHE